jgi:hypothetical protein
MEGRRDTAEGKVLQKERILRITSIQQRILPPFQAFERDNRSIEAQAAPCSETG